MTKEEQMAVIQAEIDEMVKLRDTLMGDPAPGPADGSKEGGIAQLTEKITAKCAEREKVRG